MIRPQYDNKGNTIIVHLTDAHVGIWYPFNYRRLCLILDHLVDHYSRYKNARIVVINTGDNVCHSLNMMFDKIRTAFKSFYEKMKTALGDRFKFYVAIGNHELGSAVLVSKRGYPKFRKCFEGICDNGKQFWERNTAKGMCQEVIEIRGGLKLIILNTIDANLKDDFLSADGEIGEKQLKWLDKQLRECEEKKCIIVMHHNPFPTPPNKYGLLLKIPIEILFRFYETKFLNALDDGEKFCELVKRHKQKVLAVLCGHRHWREGHVVKGINEHDPLDPVLWASGSMTIGPRPIISRYKYVDTFILERGATRFKHEFWKIDTHLNSVTATFSGDGKKISLKAKGGLLGEDNEMRKVYGLFKMIKGKCGKKCILSGDINKSPLAYKEVEGMMSTLSHGDCYLKAINLREVDGSVNLDMRTGMIMETKNKFKVLIPLVLQEDITEHFDYKTFLQQETGSKYYRFQILLCQKCNE